MPIAAIQHGPLTPTELPRGPSSWPTAVIKSGPLSRIRATRGPSSWSTTAIQLGSLSRTRATKCSSIVAGRRRRAWASLTYSGYRVNLHLVRPPPYSVGLSPVPGQPRVSSRSLSPTCSVGLSPVPGLPHFPSSWPTGGIQRRPLDRTRATAFSSIVAGCSHTA